MYLVIAALSCVTRYSGASREKTLASTYGGSKIPNTDKATFACVPLATSSTNNAFRYTRRPPHLRDISYLPRFLHHSSPQRILISRTFIPAIYPEPCPQLRSLLLPDSLSPSASPIAHHLRQSGHPTHPICQVHTVAIQSHHSPRTSLCRVHEGGRRQRLDVRNDSWRSDRESATTKSVALRIK